MHPPAEFPWQQRNHSSLLRECSRLLLFEIIRKTNKQKKWQNKMSNPFLMISHSNWKDVKNIIRGTCKCTQEYYGSAFSKEKSQAFFKMFGLVHNVTLWHPDGCSILIYELWIGQHKNKHILKSFYFKSKWWAEKNRWGIGMFYHCTVYNM